MRLQAFQYLNHFPLVPPLLQLFTFAQLANLFARLTVQTVCAGTAILFAETRSAGSTFLSSFLLEVKRGFQRGVQWRQREEPCFLVLSFDIFAQWGCCFYAFPLQLKRLSLPHVRGELVNILRCQTRSSLRPGHNECPALFVQFYYLKRLKTVDIHAVKFKK